MGFERNAAALFLKMRADGVHLGSLLTLGRQHLHLDPQTLERISVRLGLPAPAIPSVYADELLRCLGATSIESLDASPYERATRLHDLNQPIPRAWHQQFDVVFDGGTLEHVFDVKTALCNCMQMVKRNGRFISVTVANNWCGHGFYQFSPELLFRVFCPDNGFSVVEMYFADVNGRTYYRIADPEHVRSRVQLQTSEPVYLLVHARRDAVREIFATAPQQSDYVRDWHTDKTANARQEVVRPQSPWKQWALFRPLRWLRRKMLLRRTRFHLSFGNTEFYIPTDMSI